MKQKTAEEISRIIFYSQATNGKAEESIKNGAALIEAYVTQSNQANGVVLDVKKELEKNYGWTFDAEEENRQMYNELFEDIQKVLKANGGEGKGEDIESLKQQVEDTKKLMYRDCAHHTLQYEKLEREFSEYKRKIEDTPSIPSSKKFSVEDVVEWLNKKIAEADKGNTHGDVIESLAYEIVKAHLETLTPSQPEVVKSVCISCDKEKTTHQVCVECMVKTTKDQPEVGREVEFAEWASSQAYKERSTDLYWNFFLDSEHYSPHRNSHTTSELFQLFQSSTKTNKP